MFKELLGVIERGIEYLTLLQKTSHVRRLRKAVDMAEHYFFLDDELEEATTDKEIKVIKRKKKYRRKKFFKYNQ